MKLFTLLGSLAFADAALSQAQQNNVEAVFSEWDHDNSGDLTSGGVYGALGQLDKDLTEDELQRAAGHDQKVSLDQFMQIYEKVENKGGAGEYPEGCQNWFDGCNHCIIKDGKELGCTEMFCGQLYDGPKQEGFCTVFTDGRKCTSATSCSTEMQYNCFTREVWTEDKTKYCCKEKQMGCPPKQQPLQAGEVCYAFYEANPSDAVNRKDDCPEDFDCLDQNPGVMGFNTVMTCQKAGSAAVDPSAMIPKDCTSWYDGCNTCFVKNGESLGCTKRACFRQDTPKCLKYGADVISDPMDIAE